MIHLLGIVMSAPLVQQQLIHAHTRFIPRPPAGPPLRIMTLCGRGVNTTGSHRGPAESANGHRSAVNLYYPGKVCWAAAVAGRKPGLSNYKVMNIKSKLIGITSSLYRERNIISASPPVDLSSSYLDQYNTLEVGPLYFLFCSIFLNFVLSSLDNL